jgi:hypothetical protein
MTREGIVNLVVSLASLAAIGGGVALYDYRAALIVVGSIGFALVIGLHIYGGGRE